MRKETLINIAAWIPVVGFVVVPIYFICTNNYSLEEKDPLWYVGNGIWLGLTIALCILPFIN